MTTPSESIITGLSVHDVRFPTSRQADGSDAMNGFPDYSAAYLELEVSTGETGYALVFTCGRGNDVQAASIRAYADVVVGASVADVVADPGAFARRLTTDPQLRWLGPEKGSIHMAAGAIVDAVWDLIARRAGKPLWQVLSELSPEQIVALVDFRYLRDALTPDEALAILRAAEPGRAERTAHLLEHGHPAYTTSPGWLGYDDEKLVRLSREAVADGFDLIKLKVGSDLDADLRRFALAREAVGDDVLIAIDANQVWGVADAIDWVTRLAPHRPYWIEEPTSPDDVLGHAAIRRAIGPVKVATGEHGMNPVLFKQLLQAQAIDVMQIDATRVGGVSDLVANILLAAKFSVPVCPHAGGVGLCELVQHYAMFDFVAVSGRQDERWIEYVDHLHEHFVDPVRVERGRYRAPLQPGSGAQMVASSVAAFTFPDGAEWVDASTTRL